MDHKKMNQDPIINGNITDSAQKVRSLVLSEEGVSFAEYGLLITLIAVVCYLAVDALGDNISKLFEDPRIETFLTGG